MEWCRQKIELVRNEAAELKVAFEHALKAKWKSATLKRHWGLAENRLTFYQKMLAAFEAGYYIVPNFPATVFAIKTDKDSPSKSTKYAYTYEPPMTQEAKPLPAGVGEYQNPEPVVDSSPAYTDDQKRELRNYYCVDWKEIEFPANMAKLHVMEATTRAMALKIFDELSMLPSDRKRHADPMIIGHIIMKEGTYNTKRVSFMLAWHIDTKTL